MNNKLIIFATSFFLLISFAFLATVEKRQADINTKNIWMIYFETPRDNSLNFIIENHSTSTNFHWQVLSEKSVAKQGDVIINLGETKTIPVSLSDTANKKNTIILTTGEEKKEIYKSL